MFADDVFQDVPNYGFLLLDHFLGLLDGGAVALGFELVIDERLEELKRHFLGRPHWWSLSSGPTTMTERRSSPHACREGSGGNDPACP